MRLMDEHYLKHPTEGVIRMQDFLFALGFMVNHKKVRRLLRLMGLEELEQVGIKEIFSSLFA
ncbi:MAG: transposase [Alphaproteobacteria bacterium]|nr:MAG: transposase [Alphaproteobacteria bacterium]